MKIIIHSLDELLELTALLRPHAPEVILRHEPVFVRNEMTVSADVAQAAGLVEPDGLPTDIAQPTDSRGQTYDEAVAATAQLHEAIIGETLDADGVAHNTDWHSEPAKINADGRWRARRKRDEDAYKAWLLEQAVEVAEAAIAADEAEPVATETHALPQDELPAVSAGVDMLTGREVAAEPQEPGSEPSAAPAAAGSAVDLETLIAASLEAAQDASDSHVDLLNACRDFTSKHGHPAFTALKAAVAPDDAGGGKAVQHFTPGERRLMQACIANYPSN